jgi:uncharacterized repeat protein (TIGR04138 family)
LRAVDVSVFIDAAHRPWQESRAEIRHSCPYMDQSKFDAALEMVLTRTPHYDRAAYHFLREALDFTLKERKKDTGESGHVTGQQLLDGIRRYALKQFGPMVPSVLEYWNIQRTEDFGKMVFALVEVGIFGKTDSDSLEDFKDVYSFEDAFVAPFRPAQLQPPAPSRLTADSPATELN